MILRRPRWRRARNLPTTSSLSTPHSKARRARWLNCPLRSFPHLLALLEAGSTVIPSAAGLGPQRVHEYAQRRRLLSRTLPLKRPVLQAEAYCWHFQDKGTMENLRKIQAEHKEKTRTMDEAVKVITGYNPSRRAVDRSPLPIVRPAATEGVCGSCVTDRKGDPR